MSTSATSPEFDREGLFTLYAAALAEVVDLPELNKLAVQTARQVSGWDKAGLLLVWQDGFQRTLRPADPETRAPDGLVGTAYLALKERAARLHCLPTLPDCHACIPILAFDAVQAVLWLAHDSPAALADSTIGDLTALAKVTAHALVRARSSAALQDIGLATGRMMELDREMDDLLEHVTVTLGFEFAVLSIKDEYRDVIEAMRGKMAPWSHSCAHSLHGIDIQAEVLRSRTTAKIVGRDDPRFDPLIFRRYAHERLGRVWVPVVHDGEAVGTIEAGCRIQYAHDIITDENVKRLERYVAARAASIAESRPFALLERIAQHFMNILGAESASIHFFHDKHIFLAAGAGRATKDFVYRFPPREHGIGSQAMHTCQPRTIDDPETLEQTNPGVFERGVRAITAIPLELGADIGVLYFHHWREHFVTPAERSLGMVFARQMEIAIRNILRVKRVEAEGERAWLFAGLQTIIQSVANGDNLGDVLDEVAQGALTMFAADNVTIYEYLDREKRFLHPPVMKGDFFHPELMRTAMLPEDSVHRVVLADRALFIPETASDERFVAARTVGQVRGRFAIREQIVSSAVILLRAATEVVGLMFINYRQRHEFPPDEQNAMKALGSSAAIAILGARLRAQAVRDAKRREREQKAVGLIDQSIISAANERDVLNLILDQCFTILRAHAGVLLRYDRVHNQLIPFVHRGFPDGVAPATAHIDRGAAGRAIESGKPVLIGDVNDTQSGNDEPLFEGARSELAVPLYDRDDLLGVIHLAHRDREFFVNDDQAFLETVAVQSAIAIHALNANEQIARRVRYLSAFSQAARRVSITRNLDIRLRLVLTALTAGEGLGLSRAMLFLKSGTGKFLGRIAVGCLHQEEAHQTWEFLNERRRRTTGEAELSTVLADAMEFGERLVAGRSDGPLGTAVLNLELPLDESGPNGGDPLRQRLDQPTPILVRPGELPSTRNSISTLYIPPFDNITIGFAPLRTEIDSNPETVGVLVFDNAFLPDAQAIDETVLDSIKIFAEYAALCVESDRLRNIALNNLRLGEWRRFSEAVAHVVGTRLADLDATLHDGLRNTDTPDGSKKALADVQTQVANMRRVLGHFRRFASPRPLVQTRLDLVPLLKRCCSRVIARHACEIEKTLTLPAAWVTGDSAALLDVFTELLENAIAAMRTNASISQFIELNLRAEAAGFSIDISDTGPGVPNEYKARLFEPLFTTSQRGNGLGLAIAAEIVREHKGTILEVGQPGRGACFRTWLPAD